MTTMKQVGGTTGGGVLYTKIATEGGVLCTKIATEGGVLCTKMVIGGGVLCTMMAIRGGVPCTRMNQMVVGVVTGGEVPSTKTKAEREEMIIMIGAKSEIRERGRQLTIQER